MLNQERDNQINSIVYIYICSLHKLITLSYTLSFFNPRKQLLISTLQTNKFTPTIDIMNILVVTCDYVLSYLIMQLFTFKTLALTR